MYELPRKPAPLPVAPRSINRALFAKLVASRAALCSYAEVTVPRCRSIQAAVGRGGFYLRRELATLQRMAVTILRAAHAHRSFDASTLAALDRLQAFVSGQDMTTAQVAS
jgi:hypothetical protein